MGDRLAGETGGEEAKETKRRASEARWGEEQRITEMWNHRGRCTEVPKRRLTEQRRAIVPALHVYLATLFLQSIS